MLLISIPKPCHEDWNKMLPNEKGAFCAACSKVVVDFTNLSNEEVKNYFVENLSQKTCGRFKAEQLSYPNYELKEVLSLSIPIWKKIVAAVFILFGSFLTSCNTPSIGKALKTNATEQFSNTIMLNKLPKLPSVDSLILEEINIIEDAVINCMFLPPPESHLMGTPVTVVVVLPPPNDSLQKEKQKSDSTKKIITVKDDCDSLNSNSANFINI